MKHLKEMGSRKSNRNVEQPLQPVSRFDIILAACLEKRKKATLGKKLARMTPTWLTPGRARRLSEMLGRRMAQRN